MRVVYTGFSTNGAIRDNYTLVGRYLSKECRLFVLTGKNVTGESIPEAASFLNIAFDRKKPFSFLNLVSYFKIVLYILKSKADIIFFNTPHPVNIFISCLFFWKKQILYIHDPLPHSGLGFVDRFFYNLEKALLYRICDSFIVSSNAMMQAALENRSLKSKEDKIKVIYLGMLENLAFDIKYPTEKYDVLFFGRIESYKGLDILNEAMKLLVHENINCLIAGKGDIKKAFPDITSLSSNIIRLDEYLDDRKLADLICASKIIVLPYNDATGTQAIQAAFYYNKPVIATNTGSMPEYIKNMQSGMIIPAKDPRSLANSIMTLVNDDELRIKMGDTGKMLLDTIFSNNSLAVKYIKHMEDLIGKRKILLICEAGGGAGRNVFDIYTGMERYLYELHLVGGKRFINDFKEDLLEKKPNNFYENNFLVREINIIKDIRAFWDIVRIIRKVRPYIVHTHSSKAGAIGRVAAWFTGVRMVFYTPHAYILQNPEIKGLKRFIYKFLEKTLSDFFTTASINVSDGENIFAVENGIDSGKKLKVIYNGISDLLNHTDISFRERFGIPYGAIVTGTLARFDDQKDPFTFYDIAKEIINKYDNTFFIYAGEGKYKAKIEKLAGKELPKGRFITPGFIKDTADLLKAFDIYLSTSKYEGLPYSLIEAMRASLPLCVSDTTGNNEVVMSGYNGMLFTLGKTAEGINKLENMILSEDLIKFGINSYRIFEEKYKIDKMLYDLNDKIYSK